jgi:hypothetical protein
MKQNKFFSAAIALLLIVFFTTSWVFPTPALKKTAITINSVYDLTSGIYPIPGTFYTHGALEISGTVTMEVDFNSKGNRIHCVYTFVAPEGTFIIHEECVFSTPLQGQGRWEIVSGTGAYANLRGNGSALMPGNQENWKGFVY